MYRNTSCVRSYNDYRSIKLKILDNTKNEVLNTMTQYFAKTQTREQTLETLTVHANIIVGNTNIVTNQCCS